MTWWFSLTLLYTCAASNHTQDAYPFSEISIHLLVQIGVHLPRVEEHRILWDVEDGALQTPTCAIRSNEPFKVKCIVGRIVVFTMRYAEIHSIIFVPGIKDPPIEKWSDTKQGSLVENLIGNAPAGLIVEIHAVEHGLTSETLKDWNELSTQANNLQTELENFLQPRNLPIVFVCHSLGGIILKQALVLGLRQGNARRKLWQALTGTVFLGTPHLGRSSSSKRANVAAILAIYSRQLPEALTDLTKLNPLEQVSFDFKAASIPGRVLSAYERQESVTKTSNPLRNKSIVVIDNSLAEIDLRCEQVQGVNTDHSGWCTLNAENPFRKELIVFCHDKLMERVAAGSDLVETPSIKDRSTSSSSSTMISGDDQDGIGHQEQTDSTKLDSPRRLSHARTPELPCYLLDASKYVKDFFGRDDVMQDIHDLLVVPDGVEVMEELRTFVISGIGGMGKSSIAAQFVQTRLNKFDAVFWLNADTAGKLADSFGNMAVKMNLQQRGEDRDKVMSRTLVLEWLANPLKAPGVSQTKARWLLVFDNVDDFSLMEEFWPPRGAGSVLLTSRDPLVKLAPAKYHEEAKQSIKDLNLKPFSEEEAISFLFDATKSPKSAKNKATAKRIAKRLAGLPLALRQHTGIGQRMHLSLEEILETCNEELDRAKVHETVFANTKREYPYNLATVWGIEKLDHEARMLMNVLAFYDPDHVQEVILTQGSDQVDSKHYPKSGFRYKQARTGLWKHSLVTLERPPDDEELDQPDDSEPQSINPGDVVSQRTQAEDLDSDNEQEAEIDEERQPQLSIHRVVQDTTRAKMDDSQTKEAFSAAVTLLLARWKRKDRLWHYDREDWPRADHLYPHVTQLRHHYVNNMRKNPSLQKLVASKDLVSLMNCAGWYDHERGRSEESKKIFSTSLEICRDHLDSEEKLMLEIHTSLGCVATEINDAQTCFDHYQRLLQMTEERYPYPKEQEDFDALMVAKNEMGIAHMMKDRVREAWELFEDAQRIARSTIDKSATARSIYLLSSANLGLAQLLDPQLDKALATLTEAWDQLNEADKAGFAPGRIAHAIGNVKEAQNDQDAALGWFDEAYKHYEGTIGSYHHRTADVRYKLAAQHIQRGDIGEARPHIKRAMEVFKSRTHYRPELARTQYLLSRLLHIEGKKDEANESYAKARELYAAHVKSLKQERFSPECPKEEHFDRMVTFWSR